MPLAAPCALAPPPPRAVSPASSRCPTSQQFRISQITWLFSNACSVDVSQASWKVEIVLPSPQPSKTIQCDEKESLLSAVDAAGLDLPNLCRNGEHPNTCRNCRAVLRLYGVGTKFPARFRPLLPLLPAGSCGACTGRVLSGQVHQDVKSDIVMDAEQRAAGFVLLCSTYPRSV